MFGLKCIDLAFVSIKYLNESKRVIEAIVACLDGVYKPKVYKVKNK